ncbi:hypothetical protein C0992_011562, partial [Termitomyces sp. T32_za158]
MDHRQTRPVQQDLSQKLNLLESTNYQDDASKSNADRRTPSSNKDIRMLDTIALCIATGLRRDIVASAFQKADQGNSQIIYLSKNGEPTLQDINYAQTFLDACKASGNRTMLDMLPTIASRSVAMVQRRVDKLQSLVTKDSRLREFLKRKIERYVCEGVGSEFPVHTSTYEYLKSEGYNAQPNDSPTVKAILRGILKKFDEGLTFNTRKSSHLKLQSLVFAARIFRDSMFLDSLTAGSKSTERISKLCRN